MDAPRPQEQPPPPGLENDTLKTVLLDGEGTPPPPGTSELARTTTTGASPKISAVNRPAPLALPSRFGHYEVIRREDGSPWELGRGAMGVTVRALDTTLRYIVALKVIDARVLAAHPGARDRFLREAQAAAALRHPHVASVFHYGETSEGQSFYAMELIEGETLEARVRRDGPLPVGTVLTIGEQVADALVAAAKRGLIHRDLKPGNLMLVTGEESVVVKVIDFGLAKTAAVAAAAGDDPASGIGPGMDLTHGGFVGTPAFASPEQFDSTANAGGLDARADIYSLGVTLWFLLTGRVPFPGRNLAEIHDHKTRQPPPGEQLVGAGVPTPVANLLCAMLAADPADRPQSARELRDALARCRSSADPASARAIAPIGRGGPRRRHRGFRWGLPGALAFAAAALVAATALLVDSRGFPWRRPSPGAAATADAPPAPVTIPEKSVAVLPFENLSDDQANAFFADGVHDDILAGLSKIADLKVISRTSVLAYRAGAGAAPRNLREIGRALGVAHVIEGSVRRAGQTVRVTAELIDARTDAQLWAEQYDRELSDVFAIQSDIARGIVNGLRAKLSPAESAALAERPTADLVAYDLFLQAKALVAGYGEAADGRETLLHAVRLLDKAVTRDREFVLAYCLLARAHDTLYWRGLDPSPDRRALGDAAVAAALRLRPDGGEAHLAEAIHLYNAYRDFDGARRALAFAQRSLPNAAEVFLRAGAIDRRQGRWEDAVRNLERAANLDPRNLTTVGNLEVSYEMLRRYDAAARVIERARVAGLQSEWFALNQADLAFLARGDTAPFRAALAAVAPDYDPEGQTTLSRITIALCDRDPAAAERALAGSARAQFVDQLSNVLPRQWFEGQIAALRGDKAAAEKAFQAARAVAVDALRQRPDDPKVLSLLGRIESRLGHPEAARLAGGQAVELLPVAKDALDGARLLADLAQTLAWTGEKDRAVDTLEKAVNLPGDLSYGTLRLDPAWDPLRGDARFERLLGRLKPAGGAKP